MSIGLAWYAFETYHSEFAISEQDVGLSLLTLAHSQLDTAAQVAAFYAAVVLQYNVNLYAGACFRLLQGYGMCRGSILVLCACVKRQNSCAWFESRVRATQKGLEFRSIACRRRAETEEGIVSAEPAIRGGSRAFFLRQRLEFAARWYILPADTCS